MPAIFDRFFGFCRSPKITEPDLDSDSAYEYAYETISVSCSESDPEPENTAEVVVSSWKTRKSVDMSATSRRASFQAKRRYSITIPDVKPVEKILPESEEVTLSQEHLRRREESVSKEKMRQAIFHTGSFDTLKFKVVSYQKAKILLDLCKNPPHLDNGGDRFKVHMEKCNLLASNAEYELGAKNARCCIHRMSFLKTHWLAICLDPDSLDGPEEHEAVDSSRSRQLQRELKCESRLDVINAVFCVHLSTLRGYITDDRICIIQHLLNKRFYTCAALNYDLPEGRSTDKSAPDEVIEDVPWFDMVADVCELSRCVRSPNEALLQSFVQQVNARAPKRRRTTKKEIIKMTSPRGAIDPDALAVKHPTAKAKGKNKPSRSSLAKCAD